MARDHREPPLPKRFLETVLLVAAVLGSLVVLEIGLRLLTVFPVTFQSNRTEHPTLAYVVSPSLPDTDEHGFRNSDCSPDRSPVLALGDSHTYGNNVIASESFPAQLAEQLGECVYNYGVGSYGIYQYHTLLELARAGDAKHVLVALYPANDLYVSNETCRLIGSEYWQSFAAENGVTLPDCSIERGGGSQSGALLRRTATYQAVLSAMGWQPEEILQGRKAVNDENYFILDDKRMVDKDRARSHRRSTSLDDETVRANFELSKVIFAQAQRVLAKNGKQLTVLIIPSKEMVLQAWAADSGLARDAELEDIVISEQTLVDAYTGFFEDAAINYGLALGPVARAFAQAVAADDKFYKTNDGHPYANGYAAYARASADAMGLRR